jgi:hypothetical protein
VVTEVLDFMQNLLLFTIVTFVENQIIEFMIVHMQVHNMKNVYGQNHYFGNRCKIEKKDTLIIMVLAITIRSKGFEDVVFKRRSHRKQNHYRMG